MTGVSDLLLGLRLLGRGARTVLRSRRLLVLGTVPALVTTVLYIVGIALLLIHLDGVAGTFTGFADRWSPALREAVRIAAGLGLVAAVGAVAVVTFVAVTLAIGGPFYEKLSEIVDDRIGPVEIVERRWASSVVRGVRDGLLLISLSALAAIPLFIGGFIPVIGQTVVPVVAALIGGRLLTIELSAPAFERRGIGFRARRRELRRRRLLTWAIGVPIYLLCLLPLVGIIAVPIGAAAATLLARELRGERTEPSPTPLL
jgi:CysZ protein